MAGIIDYYLLIATPPPVPREINVAAMVVRIQYVIICRSTDASKRNHELKVVVKVDIGPLIQSTRRDSGMARLSTQRRRLQCNISSRGRSERKNPRKTKKQQIRMIIRRLPRRLSGATPVIPILPYSLLLNTSSCSSCETCTIHLKLLIHLRNMANHLSNHCLHHQYRYFLLLLLVHPPHHTQASLPHRYHPHHLRRKSCRFIIC